MNEDIFHLGLKAVIRNIEGEILILKKSINDPEGDGEPFWDLAGGRIQKNETAQNALHREVKEETGINLSETTTFVVMDVVNSRVIPQNGENIDAGIILGIYVCDTPEIDEVILSEEHTEYAWVSSKDAAERLALKFPETITSKIKEL